MSANAREPDEASVTAPIARDPQATPDALPTPAELARAETTGRLLDLLGHLTRHSRSPRRRR